MKLNSPHHQAGAETLEFALIAVFYFVLLFAVFEFSRALYTWNVLTEATRRGARLAAVCPYQSPIPLQVSVFNAITDTATTSSILPKLETTDVTVRYLGEAGAVVDIAGGKSLSEIIFVEVTVNYEHQMLFSGLFGLFVPSWSGLITSPTFQTTLPVESLGADPTFVLPALDTTCSF